MQRLGVASGKQMRAGPLKVILRSLCSLHLFAGRLEEFAPYTMDSDGNKYIDSECNPGAYLQGRAPV